MRHIFIINPHAGKNNNIDEIINTINNLDASIDKECYLTKGYLDGYNFVKEYCEKCKDEKLRFYACGGDGTLHEVTNGCIEHKDVEVACLAIGSGNDFVKNFGKIDDFKDINKLVNGTSTTIDLMKVDDKDYCINILNYGFDGEVTFKMLRYKGLPLVSGPMSYNLAVVDSMLFKMSHNIKLTTDDEVVCDGKTLLVAVANGLCYGGGFYCAPRAKIDDGLIDICLVKKVSRFKVASLIKDYKKGKHLENEKLKDLVVYKKCKKVTIESNKPVAYAIDGEVFRKNKVTIEIVPNKLKFIKPKLT